jgi:hypothetical protein
MSAADDSIRNARELLVSGSEGSLTLTPPLCLIALAAHDWLAAENERLTRELDEIRRWFTQKPWAEPLDPRDFGGRPYSERERQIGYGTYRDPRFLPAALAGGVGDTAASNLDALIERAAIEPIGVDISDYSDDFCIGFLAGQKNVLEEIAAGRLVLRGDTAA